MRTSTTLRFSLRAAAIVLVGSLAFASYLRGSDIPDPAPCGATVREAASAGSTMVFTVTDYRTVWRTDGTAPGTFALVGGGDEAPFGNLRTVGNRVVFTRDVVEGPLELWSTDGTPAGTVHLADLVGGWHERRAMYDDTIGTDGRRYLAACVDYGNCRWWVTDGTTAGTVALLDFQAHEDDDDDPEFELTSLGDGAVYLVLTWRHDPETVWRTDGTPEGPPCSRTRTRSSRRTRASASRAL